MSSSTQGICRRGTLWNFPPDLFFGLCVHRIENPPHVDIKKLLQDAQQRFLNNQTQGETQSQDNVSLPDGSDSDATFRVIKEEPEPDSPDKTESEARSEFEFAAEKLERGFKKSKRHCFGTPEKGPTLIKEETDPAILNSAPVVQYPQADTLSLLSSGGVTVQDLEKQTRGLQETVVKNEESVVDLEKQTRGLQETVVTNEESVGDLEKQVQGLQEIVVTNEESVGDLEKQTQGLQETVVTNEESVGDLEKQTRGLQETVLTNEESVGDLEKQTRGIQETVVTNDESVGDLEKQTREIQETVVTNEESVGNLEKQTRGLQETVVTNEESVGEDEELVIIAESVVNASAVTQSDNACNSLLAKQTSGDTRDASDEAPTLVPKSSLSGPIELLTPSHFMGPPRYPQTLRERASIAISRDSPLSTFSSICDKGFATSTPKANPLTCEQFQQAIVYLLQTDDAFLTRTYAEYLTNFGQQLSRASSTSSMR